jgi:hypothetical protein
MTTAPVCLTLIAARRLREELFEYLSAQRDLVTGFTASDAAGHGPTVLLHSAAEQVKGNAAQTMVRIILAGPDAARLLARLKSAFAGTGLVYWITPVSEFGVIDDHDDAPET